MAVQGPPAARYNPSVSAATSPPPGDVVCVSSGTFFMSLMMLEQTKVCLLLFTGICKNKQQQKTQARILFLFYGDIDLCVSALYLKQKNV